MKNNTFIEGVFIVQLSINLRLVCHNTSNKKISGVWSSTHIRHGTHWSGILWAGKLQTSEECREYLDQLDQKKFQNDKLINNTLNNFCPSSVQTLHKLTISWKVFNCFSHLMNCRQFFGNHQPLLVYLISSVFLSIALSADSPVKI